MGRKKLGIRAFITEAMGIESIVFSTSASKARYATYLSANDAGFLVRFQDISVHRAPKCDNRRNDIPIGYCVSPKDVMPEMNVLNF